MAWAMTYHLDSDTYHPLQKGSMSSSITNKTQKKMLVTKIGLDFDWMRGNSWYCRDCNIEVPPGDKVDLPRVPFAVTLEAATGAHLYRAGVIYKLLRETGWELPRKGISYATPGKHVMVTKAPRRDFEVFISHSNADEDSTLLNKTVESFKKCGINTYVAEGSPQPGYPLWQKIESAIRRADAILILWTERASQSGDVREEIGITIVAKRTKQIIPLVQTDLTTQGSLMGLEYVPLDIDNPLDALSAAVSMATEWADKKEQGKPKVAPSPPTIPLLSPIHGATDVSLRPSFAWEPVLGAEKYEFELSTSVDTTVRGYFVDALVGKTGHEALVTTVWQCDIDLDYDIDYYWHVKAITATGETPWSTGTFRTMKESL